MTNWRELGYVPNSDDEDFSDGELSTQEGEQILADQEPEVIRGIEEKHLVYSRKGQVVAEMEQPKLIERTTSGTALGQYMALDEDTVMNDATDKVYIDIDQTSMASRTGFGLGVPVLSSHNQRGVLHLSSHLNRLEPPTHLNKVLREDSVISEVDLSGLQDEEDTNLDLQEIARLSMEITQAQSRPSPDPITGEKQYFPNSENQGSTVRLEDAQHCLLPSRNQDHRQPDKMIESSSMLDSSPLSSPPSTPLPTLRPPGVTATSLQATTSIYQKNHEQWAAPARSLRERKPIQVNPYLIEGERYRQTLKSRGVRPLRIHEVEADVERAYVGDKDSQEAEYVAPPEPDQPGHRASWSEGEAQLSIEYHITDRLSSSTNSIREKERSDKSLSGETKRRKVAHTRQEANKISGKLPQRGTRPLLAAQTNVMVNDPDIYDFPRDSSHQRLMTSSTQTSSKMPVSPSDEENTSGTSVPPLKRRGLLALLELSSDSDPEPSRPNGIRLNSPVEGRRKSAPISIPSSSSPSAHSSGDEENEDESQIISRFQQKTNGVLPASWWRLDKSKQSGERSNNRRGRSPRDNTTPRLGVARARVSTRARTPEGVFLRGNSSSDESVIVSSALARRSSKEVGSPERGWIDIDNMEDDKIDRMLPATSQKRKQTKQRLRTEGKQSSHTSLSRQGNGSSRLRQSKITGHILPKKKTSIRKKPAGPRVSIVDAIRYHKATNTVSPPPFIKLAVRAAKERRDQGRRSPSKKLFILETEMDTRDVQAVLRDWREGKLSFVAERGHGGSYQDFGPSQGRPHGTGAHRHQERLPSLQRLNEPQKPILGGQPRLSLTVNPSQSRGSGSRQSALLNIMRREPVSKKIAPTSLRPGAQTNPVTTIPGRNDFATHKPDSIPRPAQFEIATPLSHTLRRLQQAPSRAPTPDIATLLQQTARRDQHFARLMEDQVMLQPMRQALPAQLNPIAHSSSVTISSPFSEAFKSSRPTQGTGRKRTPRRIDADIIERRQPPSRDTFIDDVDFNILEDLPRVGKPVLMGLLSYGSNYSLNFDTTPLKPGTIFNSETFIGGGGLSRALNTLPSSDSRRNQGSSFTFGDKIIHWGIYKDSVSADFETIMNGIADIAEKADNNSLNGTEFHCRALQVYSFCIFFSNYLAQVISFPDSIDIVSFGQRVLQAIDTCCGRVLIAFGGDNSNYNPRSSSTRLKLQILAFSLVFTFQVSQLASEDPEVQLRFKVEKLIRKLGHQLLGQLVKCRLDIVRGCYEDQRQRSKYERGIGREHYLVETWVIAIQCLDRVGSSDICFWKFFNHELRLEDLQKALNVRLFEKDWCMVFTILPLYHFDSSGLIQQPSNRCHLSENWALLKILVGRPLKVYNSNPKGHFGTIIDYCRVLYARCHHLISSWGWTNPDIIIPTLYEFFASNSLANLEHENEYGSAEFLQDLDKTPSLAVRDSDRCFHILLKVVATGINLMKTTSTARKIENLVNRLMPNHRRKYPKEEGLRIEHLTALRNHHDLLATLYWAAPSKCRPRLDAIRNLVDPELSHRRACNVSIRTWSNLLRFQLHSGENIKSLEPFMEWFDDLVTQTLNQHHAARGEAEKQFKAAKDKGDTDLSEGSLESNIRRNQIELEGILSDAVKSLSSSLAHIRGQVESATVIFTRASTANILNSYNRLSRKLVLEVLQLVQQYLLACKVPKGSLPRISQPPDEDSQDYGDSSVFDDLVVQEQKKTAAKHLLAVVYDSLHRMLSNCFGADTQPEEILLVNVVDTWALVIVFLVQNGLKAWGTYLGDYGSESWALLRNTEQTGKFTAYFMPKIIQSGPNVYRNNKKIFISFWLKTLVERESMLKFQNEYTMTLLNYDPENPILSNLPFAPDESLGKLSISQTDFRLRRLSLISTVLANMRVAYEATVGESAQKARKQEYSEMLQFMMKSMKENYQALQTKSTTGTYVKFVQKIVEYIQQHWIDLISIDRFFTDSAAFPLPSNDPLYVVGRLKNYGLKLPHQRAHKALFSFFQSLCQRAAIDGQQGYLISQLTTALSGSFENEDWSKPTIRSFFLEVIFPVYLECAFRESCGWILVVPILNASERVILAMREDIDSTLYECVKSVLSMLTSMLDGIRLAVSSLCQPLETMSPSVLGTLALMIAIVARAIPIINWLSSSGDSVEKLTEISYDYACYLIKFSGYIKNLIENCEAEVPIDIRTNQALQGPYASARKHCMSYLKADLSREWASHGGTWYASRREVCLPSLDNEGGGLEVQKKLLSQAAENLLEVACRTEMFESVGKSADMNIWVFEGRGKPYKDCVSGRRQQGKALRALGNLFC